MRSFGERFDNGVSEAAHIILALYESDIYEEQLHELVKYYGEDVVEQAKEMADMIISRLK